MECRTDRREFNRTLDNWSIGHWKIGQLAIAELVNFQAFARGRRVQGRTQGSSIGHCIRQACARTNRREFNWSLDNWSIGHCRIGQLSSVCKRQACARTNRREFNWSLHKAGACKDEQKEVQLVSVCIKQACAGQQPILHGLILARIRC